MPDRCLGRNGAEILRLLLLASCVLSVRVALINRPFLANDEGTATAIPAIHALNLARYGVSGPLYAGVLNTGLVEPRNWALYVHHPPLVPLLIAGSYTVFGVANWTTRLVPAAFSLGVTFLLYAMASRQFGSRVGIVTAAFYAFSPVTVAFGAMPDYVGAQVVFFTLATIASYLRWLDTGRWTWGSLMAVSFLLGALSDWPIFYIVPLLGTHFWVRGGRPLSRALALVSVGGAVFLGMVFFAHLASGDAWASRDASIVHQLTHRTFHLTDDQLQPITPVGWVDRVLIGHLGWLHTWPVVLLSAGYVGIISRALLSQEWAFLARHELPALLLGIAGLHLAVGIQGNYQHPWWSAIVTPGIAISASVALEAAIGNISAPLGRRVAMTMTMAVFMAFSVPTAHWKVTSQWVDVDDLGYLDSEKDDNGYAADVLGAVIRSVSRPDEGVVTTASEIDPTLWFYADRQMRVKVRTVSGMEESLKEGPYPLPYWQPQASGPRPRWFVVPPSHRNRFRELVAELDSRFPLQNVNGHGVYRLY